MKTGEEGGRPPRPARGECAEGREGGSRLFTAGGAKGRERGAHAQCVCVRGGGVRAEGVLRGGVMAEGVADTHLQPQAVTRGNPESPASYIQQCKPSGTAMHPFCHL